MTFAEAQRAIYIDFECLMGRKPAPPQPVLVGVLVGAEKEAPFEQLILDVRLAPARVASPRSRVATAATAATELLHRAAQEDRRIVGWSLFDRDRLIGAVPDRAEEIKARYVNALTIARPWRSAIYPSFPIEREDAMAPKHTLDKYAVLARYPRVLKKGNAARWIRNVQKALERENGRYSQLGAQAKRDWHALLDYNQHDCFAVQHIVLKASRELECWRAYERTRFCVDDGGRRICFMAGSVSPRLEALLRRHQATKWAFLTAWNPASVELSRAENDTRQRELIAILDGDGYRWLPGEGIGEDPSWTPEKVCWSSTSPAAKPSPSVGSSVNSPSSSDVAVNLRDSSRVHRRRHLLPDAECRRARTPVFALVGTENGVRARRPEKRIGTNTALSRATSGVTRKPPRVRQPGRDSPRCPVRRSPHCHGDAVPGPDLEQPSVRRDGRCLRVLRCHLRPASPAAWSRR